MKQYRNTVEFRVWGEQALFSDPVTRVGGEKCSYQVPTYEALKGILSSVYWKPTFVWIIDAVRVMKRIQTRSSGVKPMKYNKGGVSELSIYTYLRDVEYQVRAHFEWNLNRPELEEDRIEHKHHNIARRMIERGGRRDVFLGTRECQGYVEPCVFGEGEGEYDRIDELAFGFMLHGLTYADEAVREQDKDYMTVRFWWPIMRKGVIEFPRPEDCTDMRHLRKMEIKPFGSKYSNFSGLDEFQGEE